MTNYHIETNNSLLDFESFSPGGIELSVAQIDQAVALSDRIISERQWQTYLNSLALFGFETWLEERDSSLTLNSANCSVKQPSYANYIDGVFNLTIGEYKICLLTNGVTIDEFIRVDRALIDLPEYIAHFYILVNVVEEQAEVKIDRCIRYQDLIEQQQTNNLTPDTAWAYEIPLPWFNLEVDDLLLSLRCLQPSSIPVSERVTATDNIQTELAPLLSQLQSRETALSEILTWSQAAIIFSNPDLLNWLDQLQTNQPSLTDSLAALRDVLSSRMIEVTQTAINVKSWLSNQLDELGQNLAWTILPTPEFATSGLRDLQVTNRESPTEELGTIITHLRNSEEEIPPRAVGAYQDFIVDSYALRLFAVTWTLTETESVPEWSLLIILGAQPNNYLPQGLKLELKEGDTVLDQKIIIEDTNNSYIYTQVIGEFDEQFTVNIILADGETYTFPNFVFQ